jgi:AcrR family transcriptional regulator
MPRAPGVGRPKQKPSTEVGDRRRRDLLDAAYTLIAEKGLEGLRTRDIAARAGVNISTLHYYFGTKEALLLAVVDYVREKFTAPQQPPRSAAKSSKAILGAHLESAWRSFQTNPHLRIVLQELALRAQRDAAARAAFRDLFHFWNLLVENLLREGIRDGELREDLDPRAGAVVVTSFIMGAMTQLGVSSKAFDFGDVSRKLERWLAGAKR